MKKYGSNVNAQFQLKSISETIILQPPAIQTFFELEMKSLLLFL